MPKPSSQAECTTSVWQAQALTDSMQLPHHVRHTFCGGHLNPNISATPHTSHPHRHGHQPPHTPPEPQAGNDEPCASQDGVAQRSPIQGWPIRRSHLWPRETRIAPGGTCQKEVEKRHKRHTTHEHGIKITHTQQCAGCMWCATQAGVTRNQLRCSAPRAKIHSASCESTATPQTTSSTFGGC